MNPVHEWKSSQKEAYPRKNETHVWRIFVHKYRETIPQLRSVLHAEEHARANKFHYKKDRDSYIIAHSTLRFLLGGYTQTQPVDLKIEANDYGKPQIAESPLQFNLSHSGDLALIAFADQTPLGIDIEKIDPKRAKQDLAKRFFSPIEINQLDQLEKGILFRAFLMPGHAKKLT